MLEEHPTLRMSKATHEGNSLYMQSPEVLGADVTAKLNLSIPMFELLKEIPYTTVHATGIGREQREESVLIEEAPCGLQGHRRSPPKMDTAVSS